MFVPPAGHSESDRSHHRGEGVNQIDGVDEERGEIVEQQFQDRQILKLPETASDNTHTSK